MINSMCEFTFKYDTGNNNKKIKINSVNVGGWCIGLKVYIPRFLKANEKSLFFNFEASFIVQEFIVTSRAMYYRNFIVVLVTEHKHTSIYSDCNSNYKTLKLLTYFLIAMFN